MIQATTASAPGVSLVPSSIGLFTAGHLLWIALFAIAAIAVLIWGARQKRARKASDRTVQEHNDSLSAAAAPPAAQPLAPPPRVEPDVVPLGPAPASLGIDEGPAAGSVTQLKGLGPKVTDRLAELGITTVGQVAALTDDDAAALDAQLGPFSGRMSRDRWLEQARFLAAGDRAGFEAVFGRL